MFKPEDVINLPLNDMYVNSICPQLKFDPIDIADRLRVLDGNKATGPYNIHPYVLKQCAIAFSFPLCLLFQQSTDSGVVPESWKLANITPVHKSGSKLSTNNFVVYL